MAPPRRSLRLARELALDPAARLGEWHENPYVLRHLCQLADDKVSCGDRDSLRVARLGCRIAGRLKSGEGRARSFARLASALWLANRLDHAERALRISMDVAPSHLRGDLLRRRAYLRIGQGRLPEAVADAEAAIGLTTGAGHALALEVFGVALYYSAEYRDAIRVLARCLEETDPNATIPYCNAIHNYATSLSQGTDEEAVKTLMLCAELRTRLKDRHKLQRAKLWWTEGLLHEKLGNPQAAWWALDTSRRSLIALKAAPEVAAIVADMARVSSEPNAVRHICAEAAGVIDVAQPLAGPFQVLAAADRETIPGAAAGLKKAACRLAPCPAL